MSQTNPGNASNPQASSQALLDELRAAADRARDERLKLARMFKQTEALPVQGGGVQPQAGVSDPRIYDLTEQVQRLEQAVSEKLDVLDQTQQDIDSRTQYLESLRHTITETTSAFMAQVEQAQHFKAHVDAAKQHVRMSAGRVAEDIREHLAEYEQPIADRIQELNDLDDQIDKRVARMQQMHKQAGEAVDKHLLSALRAAKEQAADLSEPVKKEVDRYIDEQRSKLETAFKAKVEELDIDVEEALRPVTDRFDQAAKLLNHRVEKAVKDAHERIEEAANDLDPLTQRIQQIVADGEGQADLFAETIPDRLESEMNKQFDLLRERVAAKARDIIDGVDEQTMEQAGKIIHEKIAEGLDKYLKEAENHAGGYVDGLIGRLTSAREDAAAHVDRLSAKLDAVLEPPQTYIDELTQQLNGWRDQYDGYIEELSGKIAETWQQSEGYVEELAKQLEEARLGSAGFIDDQAAGLNALREQYDGYADELADKLKATAATSDGYVDELVQSLGTAREQAIAQSDEVAQQFDKTGEKAVERFCGLLDESLELYREKAQEIEIECSYDREQVLVQIQSEVERVKELADERVGHAKKVLEEASDSIHARAAASVDSALRQADKKLEEYESSSVEHLRAIDDGIEHGIEQSRKRITDHMKNVRQQVGEYEEAAKSQGEDVVRQAEEQIAEAQKRFAGFETALTQRIGLAAQTVDDAMESVDTKLNKVEQKATARVMQIVDLAETSSQGVAESIDTLAASARDTAAKAQRDLEDKLAAFEKISAEALHQSEQTLRANITELRDASRAMIEVVTRQVKAQADQIEPQTREVISNAEQTMRRRISELRDAAQGMVDIAVSRLESQLDEIKSKAQQAAFKGIDGAAQQQQPPASDAA